MKAIWGQDDVVHGEKLLCVEGDQDFPDIIHLKAGGIYTADKPSSCFPHLYLKIIESPYGANGWRYDRFIPLRYLLEE